eukprot:777687_1
MAAKLNWAAICDVLNTKGFFDNEHDSNQSKLLLLHQLFDERCEEDKVTFDDFKSQLCKSYGNKDDTQYMFYDILSNKLNYSSAKRQEFYLILVFNYLKLSQLNPDNISDILTNMVHKYDANIERHDMERIIRNKSINIQRLYQLVQMRDTCDALLSTFSILGLSKNDWLQIHKSLRTNMKIHKSHEMVTQSMDDLHSIGTSGRTVFESVECTNQDIIMALREHIVPSLKLEMYLTSLIQHISCSKLDGAQLHSMGVKAFLDILWNKCGIKKGKGRQIWTQLAQFNFDELHEEWSGDDVQSIEECNAHHIMFILRHYVLPSLKRKAITRNTDKIIQYFAQNNIDGHCINSVKRTDFCNSITRFVDDTKLKGSAGKIYGAFKTFDVSVIQCNKQMADLVDDICDKSHVLKDHKEEFRSYFEQNRIDSAQLMEMKQQDFMSDVVSFCDDKTLRTPAMQLYRALSLHTTKPVQLTQMDWERITDIKQCTKAHLLCIVDKICSDAPPDSALQTHKDTFVSYLVQNKTDGNAIVEMNRKEFVRGMIEFGDGNNKLRGASARLLTAVLAFDTRTMWDITDEDVAETPLDTEQEEEKEEESVNSNETIVWDDITQMKQCTNEHIVYILKHFMFDRLDSAILNKRRDAIITYFVEQKIDGKKLLSMNRDRQKFNDALITLYQALAEFDLSLIALRQRERGSTTEAVINVDAVSWNGISNVIECSKQQIVYILQCYLFPQMSTIDTLTNHKRSIISYLMQQKVDGVALLTMGRKQFSANLCKHCNDTRISDPLVFLYKALKTFDVSQVARDIALPPDCIEEVKHDTPLPKFDFAIKVRKSLLMDEEEETPHHGFRIPRFVGDKNDDKYPLYLHQCLWDDGGVYDEKMELLIDECVRTIQGQAVCWNDAHFVRMLYEDGIKLEPNNTKGMYYDFVKKVYLRAGGNAFFDEFIVMRDSIRYEILHVLRETYLNETGVRVSDVSDTEDAEQQQDVQQLGYIVDCEAMDEVFHGIDQIQDTHSLYPMESEPFEDGKEEKEHDICYVYYDTSRDHDRYEFSLYPLPIDKASGYQEVARLKNHLPDTFATKWAVFMNELNDTQRYDFGMDVDASHDHVWKVTNGKDIHIIPSGYWHIISEDDDHNDEEMISKGDLQLIHQLLDHYQTLNTDKALQREWLDDNTPLRLLYATGHANSYTKRDILDKDIRFVIHENEYELAWWNNANKYEPNALALINVTQYTEKRARYDGFRHRISSTNDVISEMTTHFRTTKPKPIEICYMRFQSDPQFEKIQWQSYDEKACEYQAFGDEYQSILDVLEASFLSNLKYNFDPVQFKYKFNHCLLPTMPQHADKRHSFRCKFDPKHKHLKSIISHMERITFDLESRHAIIHKVRRLIDGMDSLSLVYRNSNTFCRRWKIMRHLYTEQQQLYFFAMIVSIVAMIKYIDIEFSNQPVVTTSYAKHTSHDDGCATMDDMIRSSYDDEGQTANPQKTKILKKAIIHTPKLTARAQTIMDMDTSKQIVQMTELIESPPKDKVVYIQDVDGRRFSKEEAQFLRLMECVRKYVLEYEAGDKMKRSWPWHNNTFHTHDAQRYDALLKRFDLLHMWPVSDLMTSLKQNADTPPHGKAIRLKRQLAARMFFGPHIIARNINLLRSQLDPLLNKILDEIMHAQHTHHHSRCNPHEEESKHEQLITIHEDEGHTNINDKYSIADYCTHNIIGNRSFWPHHIQQINRTYFVNHLHMTQRLDINEFKLPLFVEFVSFLFIISDKKLHYSLMNPHDGVKGEDYKWYRSFMSTWRETPIWYTYEHDIVLLELVLRNGLHHHKILSDLTGHKTTEYKLRLKCNENAVTNDPYYAFHKWCGVEFNVLHRLKYVTNIMVKNLQRTKYGGNTPLISVHLPRKTDRPKYNISSVLFSGYQRSIHYKYVAKDQFNIEEITANTPKIEEVEPSKKCCCCNGIWRNVCLSKCCDRSACDELGYSLVPNTAALEDSYDHHVHTTRKSHQHMAHEDHHNPNDPFVARDIDRELCDTLHAFNLFVYGKPMVKCIVHQIQKQDHSSYWKVLDKVLNALPYSVAIDAIQDPHTKQILRNMAKPDILDRILYRVVTSSSFPLYAALRIADFFADISNEVWSRRYHGIACDEINKMESNHSLLLLLSIPLSEYDGLSLLSMAVDQKQIDFLSNERIHCVTSYLYTNRYTHHAKDITLITDSYLDLLSMLFFYPFKFYFTAQGHHWISGISFILYLLYIMFYLYFLSIGDTYYDSWEVVLEIILWTTNIGYLCYDVTECTEKGIRKYLVDHPLNITISLLWLLLLTLRVLFLVDTQYLQPIYLCGFGIQIVLLNIKGILLFSHTKYVNIFTQIIHLILREMLKFIMIFIWIILALLFTMQLFMLATNVCKDSASECELFAVYNIGEALKYIFGVFVGMRDWSELPDEITGIVWIIPMIVAIIGSWLLILSLIALISTEYHNIKKMAGDTVIHNRAKLILDLSHKKQLMLPPPLNVVVWIIVFIIHIINFFFALMSPSKWNIYTKIDDIMYLNLYNYNFWQCEYDHDETQNARVRTGHVTNYDWTRMDVVRFYFLEWFTDSQRKVHHSVCHGDI